MHDVLEVLAAGFSGVAVGAIVALIGLNLALYTLNSAGAVLA